MSYFSDTTNNSGLCEDTDFWCNTDSTSYPLKQKARNMNRWAYTVLTWILRAAGGWQFDDNNKTDLPIVTTTLIDNQTDYTLPVSSSTEQGGATGGAILKILAVEVEDTGGKWTRLRRIDIADQKMQRTITSYQDTKGFPREYDIQGNSIFLYPAPDVTQVTAANGLKIYISREIKAFADDGTDTSVEPGFAEPFHRILSLGAAYDFILVHDTVDKADRIMAKIKELKVDLETFYGDRERDKSTRFSPRIQNYR